MSLHERIAAWNAEAVASVAAARARTELRGGQPPGPGDVYVVDATRDLDVEWVILERGAEGDRWLAVAADLQPHIGSADLEVPAEHPAGPLVLRCGITAWLESGDLDPERRTAVLDAEILARIERKRAEIASGAPADSVLARETDAEAEYRLRIEELEQARTLLGSHEPSPKEKERRVLAFRPRIRGGSIGNPWSLAASVLLVVSLGLTGGLLWQRQELTHSEEDRLAAVRQLDGFRAEQQQRDQLRRQLEAARQEIEELGKTGQELRRRLAELAERPTPEATEISRPSGEAEAVINPPFVWLAPRKQVRGDPPTLTVSSEAPWVWLILELGDALYPRYRLEIREEGASTLLWSSDELIRVGIAEVSVALPRTLIEAGEYRLDLHGLDGDTVELIAEYELRVVVESSR